MPITGLYVAFSCTYLSNFKWICIIDPIYILQIYCNKVIFITLAKKLQPILQPNCKIYAIDSKSGKTVHPNIENIKIEKLVYKGKTIYNWVLKNGNRDILICQAVNQKKAAAKLITLYYINKQQHGQ